MTNSNVVWLLFTLPFVWGVQNFKKCNTTDFENGCPDGTKCIQTIETNATISYDGDCHCWNDNYFNQNYKSNADYCLDNPVNQTVDNTDAIHILGGILTGLGIVIFLLLIILGIQKLNIVHRISRIIRPDLPAVLYGRMRDDINEYNLFRSNETAL
ncbi:hypothetical protein Bhyg_01983 [Pseudolycoriella hygida]|uniref:Uncharacterized protein n=1 Tax=Pseudolycoriella hygida TaxID=35572 RepID=A0A9Q0NAP8_9DIPT|nr:hypothetical protein Bhyg_01983 [Pseudolycoriella hygida]